MSNYPPGVTGNEPQITGEWPCEDCGGYGYDEDEDGKHSCPWCRGTGIEPEDPPYCKNCERSEDAIEYFYHNLKTGRWACNNCHDDVIDPDDETNWERY